MGFNIQEWELDWDPEWARLIDPITTTNITFCDKYLMTLDVFVVMLFSFMTFYKRHSNLVTKMRYSSLRLTRNLTN